MCQILNSYKLTLYTLLIYSPCSTLSSVATTYSSCVGLTNLKKILASSQTRGIDTEVYHCSFDPDSLDMLIMPELDLCIFDSTSPHEYFPSRKGDIILDMYKELIDPQTDENFSDQLADIMKRYKSCVSEGTSHLAYAKFLHDDLEKYYIAATDFKIVNDITTSLIQKIEQ